MLITPCNHWTIHIEILNHYAGLYKYRNHYVVVICKQLKRKSTSVLTYHKSKQEERRRWGKEDDHIKELSDSYYMSACRIIKTLMERKIQINRWTVFLLSLLKCHQWKEFEVWNQKFMGTSGSLCISEPYWWRGKMPAYSI